MLLNDLELEALCFLLDADETVATILDATALDLLPAEIKALGRDGLLEVFRGLEQRGYVTSVTDSMPTDGLSDGPTTWWSLTRSGRKTAHEAD